MEGLMLSFLILLLLIIMMARSFYRRTTKYNCKNGNHKVEKQYGYIPPSTYKAHDIFYNYGLKKRFCKHCRKDV